MWCCQGGGVDRWITENWARSSSSSSHDRLILWWCWFNWHDTSDLVSWPREGCCPLAERRVACCFREQGENTSPQTEETEGHVPLGSSSSSASKSHVIHSHTLFVIIINQWNPRNQLNQFDRNVFMNLSPLLPDSLYPTPPSEWFKISI